MTSTSSAENLPAAPADWILVVDDDASVCRVMQAFLAHCGMEVRVAADAPSALLLLARQSKEPRLLFLDVVMPGVDGFTLARRLRASLKQTRIVLMSGSLGEKSWLPADLQELEVLAKPFRHSEVVALVASTPSA